MSVTRRARRGVITAVEPPHLLESAWQHDGTHTGFVRFELRTQKPIGTRLVVTHTVPSRLAELRSTVLAAWQTHLELLYASLHGDVRSYRSLPVRRASRWMRTMSVADGVTLPEA